MSRRNVLPALLFMFMSLIAMLLFTLSFDLCEAILHYQGHIQFIGLEFLLFFIKWIFLTLIGLLLFWLIKQFINPSRYTKYKIIYFGLLPLFICYNPFFKIIENAKNQDCISSICNKSKSNTMKTKSENLTLLEYHYLQDCLPLLPSLPTSADSISICYYNDQFLGDFVLKVDFLCENSTPIDSIDKHWQVLYANPQSGKKKVIFANSQD